MKEGTLKVAIIGCGGMAGAHLNAYLQLQEKTMGNFTLAAMCDVNAESAQRFADKAGTRPENPEPNVYTDIDKMLEAEDLDAVDICGPHFLHHTLAIACFEAGLDVIVEKPLGVTIRAGRRMIESAEEHQRILAVAEQVRRWVGPRMVEWLINRSEWMGKPRMFFRQSIGGVNQDPEQQLREGLFTWRMNKLTGGGNGIIDGGVHYADLLIYLYGEPDEVYAQVRNSNQFHFKNAQGKHVPQTVEDTALTTITFKSGVTGQWVDTSGAPGRRMGYNSYHGSLGSLHSSGPYPRAAELQLWDGTTKDTETLQNAYLETLSEAEKECLFPHGVTEGVMLELYDFLEAVRHRHRPELDGVDGLKAQAICNAIYESGWSGQSVKVDDVYNERVTGYQDEINAHWDI